MNKKEIDNIKNIIKGKCLDFDDYEYIIDILIKYLRICGIVNLDLSQLYDDECLEKICLIKNIINKGE